MYDCFIFSSLCLSEYKRIFRKKNLVLLFCYFIYLFIMLILFILVTDHLLFCLSSFSFILSLPILMYILFNIDTVSTIFIFCLLNIFLLPMVYFSFLILKTLIFYSYSSSYFYSYSNFYSPFFFHYYHSIIYTSNCVCHCYKCTQKSYKN